MGMEFAKRYEEFLNICKKLKKINIIYVDTIDKFKKLDFERFYKPFNEANRGIWIGSGLGSQFTIKLNKNPRYLNDQITNEFGYTINNGNVSTVIKFVNDEYKEAVDSLD